VIERRAPRWVVLAVAAAVLAGVWVGAGLYRVFSGG
jgi:hypothetical protein